MQFSYLMYFIILRFVFILYFKAVCLIYRKVPHEILVGEVNSLKSSPDSEFHMKKNVLLGYLCFVMVYVMVDVKVFFENVFYLIHLINCLQKCK